MAQPAPTNQHMPSNRLRIPPPRDINQAGQYKISAGPPGPHRFNYGTHPGRHLIHPRLDITLRVLGDRLQRPASCQRAARQDSIDSTKCLRPSNKVARTGKCWLLMSRSNIALHCESSGESTSSHAGSIGTLLSKL